MDYVEKFHHLGGNTIGEHRKHFNLYLKSLSQLNEAEIATVLQNIKPDNFQEAILQIILLSQYEQYEALTNILLTGNKYLNKKITKNVQLIKYLVGKYPPQEFVDKFCPKISYVTRINIINKFPLVLTDTNLAEEYFKAICERYGIKPAISAMLVSCSETFIKNIITEHNIKLNDVQLIKLHEKYPNLIEHYFNENTPYNFNKCKKFGLHLVLHDIGTFLKLSEQGFPSVGRKGLGNFIKNYKNEVIENPEKYKDILRARVVKRILNGAEYQDFFGNLLPVSASVDDFSFNEISNYLKAIPTKIRGMILFKAYEKKYSCTYNEDQLCEELLDLLAVEDRLNFQLEDKFFEYLPVEKSIDLIKEKIKLTNDINVRTELLAKLTKTCKLNKDEDALLEVLEYVCRRHKNELAKLRLTFLSNLSNQFEIAKLPEKHWNCINVLLKTAEINGEDHWTLGAIYEKLIEFQFTKGADYTDALKKYVDVTYMYGAYSIVRHKPEIERNCIEIIPKILPSIKPKRETKYDIANSLFSSIRNYNMNNLKTKLSYLKYPEYIENAFEAFKQDKGLYAFYLEGLIKSVSDNDEEEKVLQTVYKYYFDIKPTFDCKIIFLWLLKNKPELIAANAETCFDNENFKLRPIFYYEASKMHYNKISQRFKEIALNIISNESSKASQIEPALLFLSFDYKYLNLLDKYQPTNFIIDIFEDNMKEILDARKAVLNSLCYIPVSNESIFKIYPYCKGDYLQHATRTLHKALYNIPQELIEEPINFLLQNKQSREQAIYLVSNLQTSQRIRTFLTEIGSSEESRSIRKLIFKRTFKLFGNFPDDEFWKLLLMHFQLVDRNDSESFKLLLEIHNIPIKFRPQYTKLVWDYAVQLKKHYEVVPMLKLEIWKQLSKEFHQEILSKIIFDDKNEEKEATYNLLYQYLLNGGDLSIVYKKSLEAPILFDFLVNLCSDLIKETKPKMQALELSKKLTNSISEVPIKHHKYPLQILFESTYYFLQIENNFLDTLEFLLKKQDEAITKFGMDIAHIYRDFAAKFLNIVINSLETSKLKNREYKIMNSFLHAAAKIAKSGNDCQVKLLALHLIPKWQSKDKAFNRKRKEVVDVILASSDDNIKICVANAYYAKDI